MVSKVALCEDEEPAESVSDENARWRKKDASAERGGGRSVAWGEGPGPGPGRGAAGSPRSGGQTLWGWDLPPDAPHFLVT